jgi:hypothetical protein
MSKTDAEVIISLMAQKIHGNDSMHRHHDLDKPTCSYCTNVAKLAYSVLTERAPFLGAEGLLAAVAVVAADTLREQAESLLKAAHQLDGEDR